MISRCKIILMRLYTKLLEHSNFYFQRLIVSLLFLLLYQSIQRKNCYFLFNHANSIIALFIRYNFLKTGNLEHFENIRSHATQFNKIFSICVYNINDNGTTTTVLYIRSVISDIGARIETIRPAFIYTRINFEYNRLIMRSLSTIIEHLSQ